MHRLLVFAPAFVLACSSAQPPPVSPSPAGTGPAYSSLNPGAERTRMAATMTGSCNFARPPGKADEYPTRLRTQAPPSVNIPVRARAIFRGRDRSNVIGELVPGTLVYGRGPVKDSEASPGMGYVILVQDSGGRVCHGYVHTRFVRLVPAVRR